MPRVQHGCDLLPCFLFSSFCNLQSMRKRFNLTFMPNSNPIIFQVFDFSVFFLYSGCHLSYNRAFPQTKKNFQTKRGTGFWFAQHFWRLLSVSSALCGKNGSCLRVFPRHFRPETKRIFSIQKAKKKKINKNLPLNMHFLSV